MRGRRDENKAFPCEGTGGWGLGKRVGGEGGLKGGKKKKKKDDRKVKKKNRKKRYRKNFISVKKTRMKRRGEV